MIGFETWKLLDAHLLGGHGKATVDAAMVPCFHDVVAAAFSQGRPHLEVDRSGHGDQRMALAIDGPAPVLRAAGAWHARSGGPRVELIAEAPARDHVLGGAVDASVRIVFVRAIPLEPVEPPADHTVDPGQVPAEQLAEMAESPPADLTRRFRVCQFVVLTHV